MPTYSARDVVIELSLFKQVFWMSYTYFFGQHIVGNRPPCDITKISELLLRFEVSQIWRNTHCSKIVALVLFSVQSIHSSQQSVEETHLKCNIFV